MARKNALIERLIVFVVLNYVYKDQIKCVINKLQLEIVYYCNLPSSNN